MHKLRVDPEDSVVVYVFGGVFAAVKSVENREAALYALNLSQLVVVAVEHDASAVAEVLEHLGFSAENAVTVAEILKVTFADNRYNLDRRLNHFGKARHFAEARNSHFDNGSLGGVVHPEQRQRNAELVVEVALSFMYLIFLREHGGYHLFGRGLSDAAAYSDDRNIEHLAVSLRYLLYCRERIVNENVRLPRELGSLLAQRADRAVGVAFADKVVTVNARALDREEERIFLYAAAVTLDGADGGVDKRLVADIFAAARLSDLSECKVFHSYAPLYFYIIGIIGNFLCTVNVINTVITGGRKR